MAQGTSETSSESVLVAMIAEEEEEDERECRICRDTTEPLFAPCGCSGSIKYCHLSCLLTWLSISQTERLRSFLSNTSSV